MQNIEVIERVDKLIAIAEDRRNKTLQEVERHRARLAEALRRATDEIIEADSEDVPLQPGNVSGHAIAGLRANLRASTGPQR